jgi:hypothetical protein
MAHWTLHPRQNFVFRKIIIIYSHKYSIPTENGALEETFSQESFAVRHIFAEYLKKNGWSQWRELQSWHN